MSTVRALLLLMLLLGLSGLLAPPFAMATVAPLGAPKASTAAEPCGMGSPCHGCATLCVETDCNTCHAHGAAMALGDTPPPRRPQASTPGHTAERRHTAPWRERPDRPQWAAPSDRG